MMRRSSARRRDSMVWEGGGCSREMSLPSPGAFTERREEEEGDKSKTGKSSGREVTAVSMKERITVRAKAAMKEMSQEQRARIAARNDRALQLHQRRASHATNNDTKKKGSVCSSRATTKSNSRAVSVSMLSDASKKKAKERELVAKLQLLKSLREKDNELEEITKNAYSQLKKQEMELEDCQQQGMLVMSAVEKFLTEGNPPSEFLGESQQENMQCDNIIQMIQGTAAFESPTVPSVNRIVRTRKLSRRMSEKLESSIGKNNMRCDAQMSSVFLKCMYDTGGDDDASHASADSSADSLDVSELRDENKIENRDDKSVNKENSFTVLNSAEKQRPTREIVLQTTVPPWEVFDDYSLKNTQATLGEKPYVSYQRLEDRVLDAIQSAQALNKSLKNNALRTHFGYYYDSDDNEDLRPVIREENGVPSNFIPFGHFSASTVLPSYDADEGAQFFDDYNARVREADSSLNAGSEELASEVPTHIKLEGDTALPPPPPPSTSPAKKSVMSSLFGSLSPVSEIDD